MPFKNDMDYWVTDVLRKNHKLAWYVEVFCDGNVKARAGFAKYDWYSLDQTETGESVESLLLTFLCKLQGFEPRLDLGKLHEPLCPYLEPHQVEAVAQASVRKYKCRHDLQIGQIRLGFVSSVRLWRQSLIKALRVKNA